MLVLKNNVWELSGQVQAVIVEERVLNHDQLIGAPILCQPLSDHFYSMLNVDGRIRLLLAILREWSLDGEQIETVLGDDKNFVGLFRGVCIFLNFYIALRHHYLRSITHQFLCFFVLRLLFVLQETSVRLLFRYKNDLFEVGRATLGGKKCNAFVSFFCMRVWHNFFDVVKNNTEIALWVQLLLWLDAISWEGRIEFNDILRLQK